MKKDLRRLPDTELEIMQAIWGTGKQTVTSLEIKAVLEKRRPWNLSALLTLLSRLVSRGFLTTAKLGKMRSFTVVITEKEFLEFENRSFLERVNHNSLIEFMESLFKTGYVSEQDIKDLQELINQYGKAM